jgi:hypothetical protein
MRVVKMVVAEGFPEQSPRIKHQAAVGYLSLWAADSERYAVCRLFCQSNGDIMANYFREGDDSRVTYSLLGQWSGTDYSFHS